MLMSPGAGAVQEIKSRSVLCAWPVALGSNASEETSAILRFSCMCFGKLGVTSSDLVQGQISPPLWSLGNKHHFKQ